MWCAPHNTCGLFQWPPHEILSSYCILSQNHIGQEHWWVTPEGDHIRFLMVTYSRRASPSHLPSPACLGPSPGISRTAVHLKVLSIHPQVKTPPWKGFLTLFMASKSHRTMKTRYKTQSILKPLNACVLVKHDSVGTLKPLVTTLRPTAGLSHLLFFCMYVCMELGCESQGVSTLFLITVIVWCVYTVYECGWVLPPVCECGGPEAEKAYSITSPTHLFRQILQWLGCINPIRLTGQWAPRILLYHTPSEGVTGAGPILHF